MAFRVDITETALADAEEYVDYVRREKLDPVGAERWWNGFLDAVLSLEERPARCSRVAEATLRTKGLRQLLYQSHRIVFDVDGDRQVVRVLRIYHASRRQLRFRDVRR